MHTIFTILLKSLTFSLLGISCALSMEKEGSIHQKLLTACENGKQEEVLGLLEQGADINTLDSDAPLTFALYHKHSSLAHMLIEKGADINLPTSGHAFSPLMVAAIAGMQDIVRLLIELRAQINVQSSEGTTALMYALMYGNLEIAQMLLDAGADIHLKNKKGNNALTHAVDYAFMLLNQLTLKERNALVEKHNSLKQRLYILKAQDASPELYKAYISFIDTLLSLKIEMQSREVQKLFCIALAGNNLPIIKTIIETPKLFSQLGDLSYLYFIPVIKNRYTDIVDYLIGYKACMPTLLFAAVHERDENLVIRLLQAKVDINDTLLLAIDRNDKKLVTLLLENNANLSASNNPDEPPPLIHATFKGYKEITEILLAHRASLETQWTKSGRTALIYAVREGHVALVQLLLDAGANPNVQDNSGFWPLTYAAKHGNDSIVQALLNAGASVDAQSGNDKRTPLLWCNHHTTARLLLKAGANVNALNAYKESPLIEAIRYVNPSLELINLLIEYGVDIHHGGEAPLRWALMLDEIEIAKLLLEKKANLDSAFFYAAKLQGLILMAKLVSLGADISTYGEQIFESAQENNQFEALRFLEILEQPELYTYLKDTSRGIPYLRTCNGHAEGWLKSVTSMFTPSSTAASTCFHQTKLMWAVMFGHTEVVKSILKRQQSYQNKEDQHKFRCYLNAQDKYGRTALMYAIIFDESKIYPLPYQAEILSLLLEAYKNLPNSERNAINISDMQGNSALAYAVKQKNLPLITHLLEIGARPTIKLLKDAAKQGQHTILAKLLFFVLRDSQGLRYPAIL